MRAFHAALSPALGAPAMPAPWHATHTLLYSALPASALPAEAALGVAGLAAGPAEAPAGTSPMFISPTGLSRCATAAGLSGPSLIPPVAKLAIMTIPMTGTRNDRSTTTISCWGVLISMECSSPRASDMKILFRQVFWEPIIGHRYCVAEARHGRGSALPVHWPTNAPVAQLDRVSASEAEGRGFDSLRARQFSCRASPPRATFSRESRSFLFAGLIAAICTTRPQREHCADFAGELSVDGPMGLGGLFLSSFLAATLLPGGSEIVFAAVLAAGGSLWPALAVATGGNTLGG